MVVRRLEAFSPMTAMTTVIETRRGMLPVLPASVQSASASPGWPLYAALDLGALLTAPGCGRAWSAALLREWQLAHLTDTAQVVVSELLTNAVRASARGLDQPTVQLSLASDGSRLLILVRDFNPGAPVPRHTSNDDETGRGLMLVEAISDRFGWYRPEDGAPGKVVWAVVGLTADHGSRITTRRAHGRDIARDDQPSTEQRRPVAAAIGTAGRRRADFCSGQRRRRGAAVQAAAGCYRCRELGVGRPGDPTPREVGPRPAMTRNRPDHYRDFARLPQAVHRRRP